MFDDYDNELEDALDDITEPERLETAQWQAEVEKVVESYVVEVEFQRKELKLVSQDVANLKLAIRAFMNEVMSRLPEKG